MNVFKKILGVILILVAILLLLGTMTNIPNTIAHLSVAFTSNSFNGSYDLGYALGYLLSNVVFIVIIFFLFKFGVRLLRNKQDKVDNLLDSDLHRYE